jgi:hypothetical protein
MINVVYFLKIYINKFININIYLGIIFIYKLNQSILIICLQRGHLLVLLIQHLIQREWNK